MDDTKIVVDGAGASPRQPRAGQQDFVHTLQGGGHSRKHLAGVGRFALVLVMAA